MIGNLSKGEFNLSLWRITGLFRFQKMEDMGFTLCVASFLCFHVAQQLNLHPGNARYVWSYSIKFTTYCHSILTVPSVDRPLTSQDLVGNNNRECFLPCVYHVDCHYLSLLIRNELNELMINNIVMNSRERMNGGIVLDVNIACTTQFDYNSDCEIVTVHVIQNFCGKSLQSWNHGAINYTIVNDKIMERSRSGYWDTCVRMKNKSRKVSRRGKKYVWNMIVWIVLFVSFSFSGKIPAGNVLTFSYLPCWFSLVIGVGWMLSSSMPVDVYWSWINSYPLGTNLGTSWRPKEREGDYGWSRVDASATRTNFGEVCARINLKGVKCQEAFTQPFFGCIYRWPYNVSFIVLIGCNDNCNCNCNCENNIGKKKVNRLQEIEKRAHFSFGISCTSQDMANLIEFSKQTKLTIATIQEMVIKHPRKQTVI